MRVPARFYPFLSFPLAYFAARGFEAFAADAKGAAGAWSRWGRKAAGPLAVAVVLLELAPLPPLWLPVEREAGFPPAYAWIASRGDVRAVLELPMATVFSEVEAMYHASLHWKPIVNGYSGYMPPDYLGIFRALGGRTFRPPDERTLDRLRGWGVTHVLVRTAAYRRPEDLRALAAWEAGGAAALVYDGGGDRIYRIGRSDPIARIAPIAPGAGPAGPPGKIPR
jgi:hypothetical protein